MIGTLFIRADASPAMGTGHVMRCIALAQEWLIRGGQALMISTEMPDSLRQRLELDGIDCKMLTCVSAGHEDFSQTIALARAHQAQWVILDGYQFDVDYHHSIRHAGFRLCVIDDYAHLPQYEADILVNQNINASRKQYGEQDVAQWLLGSDYVLLRDEFRAFPQKRRHRDLEKPWNLLVTLGGSDSHNVTKTVILGLVELEHSWRATVVVGAANLHKQGLEEIIEKQHLPISVISNSNNMSEMIRDADLVISAAGSTCWEICYLGVPSAVTATAQNQKGVLDGLVANDAVISLGWYADLDLKRIAVEINQALGHADLMRQLSANAKTLIDGAGRRRLVATLLQLNTLIIRPAYDEDAQQIFRISNTPSIRAESFSMKSIEWNEHLEWFRRKLRTESCLFLIADISGHIVAQARFEREGSNWIVSVSVDPAFQGLGVARKILTAGIKKLRSEGNREPIVARIRRTNTASCSLFRKLGFRDSDSRKKLGNDCVEMIHTRCSKNLIMAENL